MSTKPDKYENPMGTENLPQRRRTNLEIENPMITKNHSRKSQINTVLTIYKDISFIFPQ